MDLLAEHEGAPAEAVGGDLSGLERIWRHEEEIAEIAAIADDLLLPDDARGRLEAWRHERDEDGIVESA